MNNKQTIKNTYNLSYGDLKVNSGLIKWYNRLLDKTADELDEIDISKMIRQDILVDLAIDSAINILKDNPYAGEMYDGDVLNSLNSLVKEKPEVTWYGWDGDRLVTAQTEQSRIQTIYEPGGFTPLVRVETGTEALATTRPQRSLAEKLRQEGNEDGTEMAFPAELVHRLDRLENELRRNAVSEESRKWLAQCGLTAEQMAGQLDAQTEPERTVHLYHCDHRGLPVALINSEGVRDWSAEYDVWGNRLKEDNPQKLAQLIRLPGQQYDDETGLYYNRYRYYNPEQGRYISQDPIGLHGGLNPYTYPLNPVTEIDPLGLWAFAIPAIIEGINWLFWGSTVTGGAVLATSGDSEKSKNKTESLTNCPTMPPNDPCDKKLDKGLLQKAGIEKMEHSIKIESVGRNNISKFDLCGCNNGKIVIKEHGCKGKSIVDETEYTWK